jgi:hypothetical protein
LELIGDIVAPSWRTSLHAIWRGVSNGTFQAFVNTLASKTSTSASDCRPKRVKYSRKTSPSLDFSKAQQIWNHAKPNLEHTSSSPFEL